MAKKIHNCIICDREYKANVKTNIKTCEIHRGTRRSGVSWLDNQKLQVNEFNLKFKTIRINNCSGYLNLSLKPQTRRISAAQQSLSNMDISKEFLLDLIEVIKKDIKLIENEQETKQ